MLLKLFSKLNCISRTSQTNVGDSDNITILIAIAIVILMYETKKTIKMIEPLLLNSRWFLFLCIRFPLHQGNIL